MSTGVRVVGATDQEAAGPGGVEPGPGEQGAPAPADPAPSQEDGGGADRGTASPAKTRPAKTRPAKTRPARAPGSRAARRPRRAFAAVAVVAVLGVAGTVGFGVAWAGQRGQAGGEAQAKASARTFLVALTNFDAKTVDADFSAITDMATGPFAGQADKFFNSSIRQQLEDALASSRGQIRDLYVQTYDGARASVYAVVDQLYANNKLSSPQSDVLRIVVDLAQVGGAWKVADVTVLTGPSLGSGSGATASTGTTGSTTSTGSTASTGTGTSGSTTPAPAG